MPCVCVCGRSSSNFVLNFSYAAIIIFISIRLRLIVGDVRATTVAMTTVAKSGGGVTARTVSTGL